MDRLEKLPEREAAEVRGEFTRKVKRGIQDEEGRKGEKTKRRPGRVSVARTVGEGADQVAKRVRTAAEFQMEHHLERYVYDEVAQSPELAEKLQFLVGRKFIDDENGRLYTVDRVTYSETARAVVGFRRSLTGNAYKYDDDAFHVYGEMGLYQLTDLYGVEGDALGEVR